MRKLHQQVKAKADIKDIWLYSYENFGLQQAEKYYDELISGMETLEENPEIGVACDYIRSGYRQYKINEHFVFYRLSKSKIHIIRVLHESNKTFIAPNEYFLTKKLYSIYFYERLKAD